MKKHTLIAALAMATSALAQPRQEVTLENNWQFSRNNSEWSSVSVPHDWAISGPFDKKWDLQVVAIEQNGEKEKSEKSGRSGALPWIGKGYYKRTLSIPQGYKHAELVFDGAMSHAHIYMNGKEAGAWPYGYNSFAIDVTPYLIEGATNTLAVRLENEAESSRWYPGAGLYRNVHLLINDEAHIPVWGTTATH